MDNRRLLSDKEGAEYVGLGVSSFRIWSAKIGAKKKIGNRSLNDRKVIDAALDTAQDFKLKDHRTDPDGDAV